MNKKFIYVMAAGLAFGLAACTGEDSINENATAVTVESLEDLAECTEDNAGEMAVVEDSSAVYFCADGEWKKLNGNDGNSGTSDVDTVFRQDTLVVRDTLRSLDTIFVNQKDTVVFLDSIVGLNGSGCTAEAVDGGYQILCDGDTVGVVLNGEQGESSTDTVIVNDTLYTRDTVVLNQVDTVIVKDTVSALDGKNCTVEAIEGGYKVLCGGDSVGVLLNGKNLCGGAEYDIASQFCYEGKTYDLCGGKSYDPDTQCCFDGLAASCLVDARDGQKYKTVVIGTQTWMAQNLNYADSAQTPSLQARSWCYNESTDSCAKYGRLYTWAAAIDSAALEVKGISCGAGIEDCELPDTVQGICPTGWHLPSTEEWGVLINVVGGKENAGMALKATSGWSDDGNGLDTYGFSALPAGYFAKSFGFCAATYGVAYWTSSENEVEENEDEAYDWYFSHDEAKSVEESMTKIAAQSVRCVKD